MFKKHMTPLRPHSRDGDKHVSVNKASNARELPSAATGGGPASFQSYAKATPMAQPSPTPAGQGLGSGAFPGNPIG